MALNVVAVDGAGPGAGGGDEGGEGGAGAGGVLPANGADAPPQAVRTRAESRSEKLQSLFTGPGTHPSKLQ